MRRRGLYLQTVPVQIGSAGMRASDRGYDPQARSTAFQIAGAVLP